MPIKRVFTALPNAKISHLGQPQLKYNHGALAEKIRGLEMSVFRSAHHKGIAALVENAKKYGIQISPGFSQLYNFTSEQAYQIAAEACFQRMESKAGSQRSYPVGRKIGFTNKNIWPEYNISSPIWGYMYNTTVATNMNFDEPSPEYFQMNKSSQEPKIEPEVVLGISMKKTPRISMSDLELLDCISWIGHGFEIVDSLFPGWKFDGNDTIIAGALHRNLVFDRRQCKDLSAFASPSELLTQLENFQIDLYCNGELMDSGRGSNVLGSPIKALRFLVDLLSKQRLHPEVQPGEIITTGTLTKALPIDDGSEWHTEIRGIDLPGYRTRFKFFPPKPRMWFGFWQNRYPAGQDHLNESKTSTPKVAEAVSSPLRGNTIPKQNLQAGDS